MCEIFFLKHNKKGIRFAKEDLQSARDMNSDGAGFVILEYDLKKKKWEIMDMATYGGKPKTYSYYNRTGTIGYNNSESGAYESYAEYEKDNFLKTKKVTKKVKIYKAKGDTGDYELNEDEAMEVRDSFIKEFGEEEGIKMFDDWYEVIDSVEETIEEEEEEEEAPSTLVTTNDNVCQRIYQKQFGLKPRQIMITHFRLATSGMSQENTQPILEGDYMVIHNGIFHYKSLPAGRSDTRHFTHKLNTKSKRSKGKVTAKREIRMIEELLKDAGGYYSIFIYSFKTGQLFYFKNDFASFYYNNNGLTGATKSFKLPTKNWSAQEKEVVKI